MDDDAAKEKRRQQLRRLHAAIREKQKKRTRNRSAAAKSKDAEEKEKENPIKGDDDSLYLPTEMWMEIFAFICVKHKLYSNDEALKTIAKCMLVCRQWNRILKTKFAGNPLFDEDNARLYVVDSEGKLSGGIGCISDVKITINERGVVEKITKRKVDSLDDSLLRYARAWNALLFVGNSNVTYTN